MLRVDNMEEVVAVGSGSTRSTRVSRCGVNCKLIEILPFSLPPPTQFIHLSLLEVGGARGSVRWADRSCSVGGERVDFGDPSATLVTTSRSMATMDRTSASNLMEASVAQAKD